MEYKVSPEFSKVNDDDFVDVTVDPVLDLVEDVGHVVVALVDRGTVAVAGHQTVATRSCFTKKN